ncbi:MAG TPA: hypothetical protein VKA85_05295, partial [Candidatus Limnocylindrales bacterium]|nr:hypothetical protein [Candidatus Limnocylindrales bacterium]
VGMVAWAFALIAPATFIIVGLARIVTVVDSVASSRPRSTPASRLARVLGDEYVVASRVRLPDGRMIPDLIVGPFGAAILEELPPPAVSRRHAAGWEVRTREGRWIPLENPLERASRDADRVRRWFAEDDQDFVVKVYAAVVSRDSSVPRSATCAVITADQIPAWIASLPAQRSLNEGRRDRLVELLRDIA